MNKDHSEISQLKNGLTVVTRDVPPPNGYEPLARISVRTLAGSRDEVTGNYPRGAMHFLEHGIGYGSQRHRQPIRELIEGIKGFNENYGSFDLAVQLAFTNVEAVVPAGAANYTLDVIGSALSNPIFDRANVDFERPIIQIERKENRHDFGSLENLVAAYVGTGRHPRLHPVIGSKEGIDAVTPDVLYDIHARNFRSGRIIVSVEGPVKHADIIKSAENYFTMPSGIRPWSDDVPCYTGGYATYPVSVEGTRVAVAFKSPRAVDYNDLFAFHVVENLLRASGDKDAHSMFSALRNQQVIYKVKLLPQQMMDAGIMTIAFVTSEEPEYAAKGIRTVQSVLSRLVDEVDDVSFNRVRKIEERTYRHLKKCDLYGAGEMADSVHLRGVVTPMLERSERRFAVTKEDVRRVAHDMLIENPPTVLAAGDVSNFPSRSEVAEIFGRTNLVPHSRAVEEIIASLPKSDASLALT